MANLIKAVTGWRTLMEVQQHTPGTPMVVMSTDRALPQAPQAPAAPTIDLTLEPAASG
jgi:DNA-binding NtrC family response regulator